VDTGQIVLYVVLGAAGILLLRRYLLTRSVPQYSAEEVAGKLRNRDAVLLLDVRTADERARESIKGSIHIPVHELRRRAGELEKHRNREIICYCATGSRSLSAAGALRSLGMNAANMTGGMAAWNMKDSQ
jgi:rhodanese-related sulfurtransferase